MFAREIPTVEDAWLSAELVYAGMWMHSFENNCFTNAFKKKSITGRVGSCQKVGESGSQKWPVTN